MRLAFGNDALWARWAAQHIPHMNGEDFGACATVGVVNSEGYPIGAVVFHEYQPQYGNVMVSMASATPKWLTRSLISGILAVPFRQYGVQRLTAITPPGETSVARFLQKFGWRREGVIRKGLGSQDAWIWGLLASEWNVHRFNLDRAVSYGQINPQAASGPRSHRRRRRAKRGQHCHGAGAAAA